MKRAAYAVAFAVAALSVVGCDNKETRSGSITLAGAANIPLNDKSGARAELASGQAEITFQKGSRSGTVAVRVRQPNRAEVNLEAPIGGDYRTGNFTLRGSEIGQPVDLVSARDYKITGGTQRWSNWEDQGFERCLVEYSFDPCDEDWTVTFHAPAGDLGAFAARTSSRCNERRNQTFCQPIPGREPRVPDFPRGPHGRGMSELLSTDPSSVKFD